MPLLSFVIPCYCSAQTLPDVVGEIISTAGKRLDEYDYEIILVNDDSRDNTLEIIRALCRENPKIKGISFSRNFGQHSAVMAGFSAAKGDIIINLDDDGQTPVDEVFLLVDTLNEGYDAVFARYVESPKRPLLRRAGTAAKERLNCHLLGKPRDITFNSYFAVRSFVIAEVVKYTNPYPYLGALIYRTTTNIANVDVHHRARAHGTSTYTMYKLLRVLFNEITSFSIKPLRIAVWLGFFSALIGFVFMLYVGAQKLMSPNISAGWSSLVFIMLFIGGVQMVIVGIVGEYVGRIYTCLNKNPQYIVRKKFNLDEGEDCARGARTVR